VELPRDSRGERKKSCQRKGEKGERKGSEKERLALKIAKGEGQTDFREKKFNPAQREKKGHGAARQKLLGKKRPS